ncbi:MAG: hypothetical protein M5U14_11360 [Acidimicrobiia bacterium]|nr:hypothetical protein [Acidimicrobiia bacterium]
MSWPDPAGAVPGFEADLAGRRAECDGGHALAGTHFAVREEYAGTLTGDYVEEGDPPWRWYLLAELTRAPRGYPCDTVWCEAGNLFVVD